MNFLQKALQAVRGSRIGLGMAAIGRPAYINIRHEQNLAGKTSVEALRAHAFGVLDAAFAEGIRYFDAARSYGKAESFLGDWLAERAIKPGEVVIGSKWGYTYIADWKLDAEIHEVKEHSIENFRKQWQETKEILGNYLTLYQIHSATLDSGVLDNEAVLNALKELKDSGVGIGLTVSGPEQALVIRKAVGVRHGSKPLFDSVQATWNLLEGSAHNALQTAHDMGVSVIVKEALANGRLTAQNVNPDFRVQRKLLIQEAKRLDTTVDALAIAAVLNNPWADIVLSGAAHQAHVRSNVQALSVKWDEFAAENLASLHEDTEAYWHFRSQLEWK